MVTAIVLITCEVDSVAGDWDLAAIVRVGSHDDLAATVTNHIRKTPGVATTNTLIAFRTYSRHDLDSMFSVGFEGQGVRVLRARVSTSSPIVSRPRPSSTSRVVCEPVNGSSPVPVCEVPPAAVPPEDDPVLMSMAMRDGLLSSSTLNGTRWSTPRP